MIKHGKAKTRLYNVWSNMLARCNRKNHPSYNRYGARGISVCPEWRKPERFLAWAEQNGYRSGLELDRIDNNGNYTPDNCRFISKAENLRNRSTPKINPDDARAIRMLCWSDLSHRMVAKIFGIGKSTVNRVVNFQTWKDV